MLKSKQVFRLELHPAERRCCVNGRCPTVVNIRVRGTETFTGRFNRRAAMAASMECGQGKAFRRILIRKTAK